MGRVISSGEHNIPGIVSVGRQIGAMVILPTDLAELQLQRIGEIETIKELARHGLSGQVQVEAPSTEYY
jgi:hypothetical protein